MNSKNQGHKRKSSELVRGSSELFCVTANGIVTRHIMKERFCPSDIKATASFISNNNLHNIPSQARGTLIVVCNAKGRICLGVVVKLFREDLSCLVSLLNKDAPVSALQDGLQGNTCCHHFTHVRISNLRSEYHRLLQQVGGAQFASAQNRKRTFRLFPFIGEDGNVSMNPDGPDILLSVATNSLPGYLSKAPCLPLFSTKVLQWKDDQCQQGIPAIYITESSVIDDWRQPTVSDREYYGVVHGVNAKKETMHYTVMYEYRIKREDALDICRINYSSAENFTMALTKVAMIVNEVPVPKYNQQLLRIKVVSPDDMLCVKQRGKNRVTIYNFNNKELVFGSERQNLDMCLGYLLSSSTQANKQVKETVLSYEFSKLLFQVYGNGFGSRWSVASSGPNIFTGKRLSKRSSQTPDCSLEHVEEQQYYRHSYGCPLGRVVLEKCTSEMNQNVTSCSYKLHPEAYRLINNCCNRTILTSGGFSTRPIEKGINISISKKKSALLAYTNIQHRDMCDRLSRKVIEEFAENAKTNYEKKLVTSPFFCMPTTCAYQVLWNGEHDTKKLRQYFVCRGLGNLTLPIGDGFCHHFLGGSYRHYSSIAYVEDYVQKTQSTTIITNNLKNEVVSVLGWGRSGGSPHARAELNVSQAVRATRACRTDRAAVTARANQGRVRVTPQVTTSPIQQRRIRIHAGRR
jgi:hypothetical protein